MVLKKGIIILENTTLTTFVQRTKMNHANFHTL